MNVPRQYEVVVTTPSFRRGQSAAWRDFEKDPDATPNRDLLAQLVDREFAAGYVDEWENFCVPMRKVRQPCPNEHLHDATDCEDCDYLGQ